MAKRFIDTSVFKKGFVRSLPTKYKLFWIYITSDCDHAGIWIKDFEIATLYIGEKITESDAKKYFNDKIIELDGGEKWIIPSFIEFQYGNLYKNNKAHYAVIKLIEKYGLENYFSIDDSRPEDVSTFRKRITQNAKNQIFSRDGHRCQYCGDNNLDMLNIDHIVPLTSGGNNQNYNLITCCVSCNSKKSNHSVFEFIEKYEIKLLEGAYKKIEEAFNFLNTPMDKDMDKDKDMVKEMVKEKTESLNFPFSSETFLNQWDILVKMKKWKSKPHSALQASLNKLSRYCEFDAIRMIENAIAGNWMGFVELKPHEISKPQMSKIEKGMQDIEDSKPLIAKIFSDEPNS